MVKPLGEDENLNELVIKVRLGDACMDEHGLYDVLGDIAQEIHDEGTFAKSKYLSIDGNTVAEIEWK